MAYALFLLGPFSSAAALSIPARKGTRPPVPGYMQRHPWQRLGAAIGITALWALPTIGLLWIEVVVPPPDGGTDFLPDWLFPCVSALVGYAAARVGVTLKRKWAPR
ncbi:hypothetical protein ACFW1A_17810 [Kitasatospora sp. NPDC058965]|uniref:hypothetical protein n=1 Tax=Kitasatospora sp. NPDC058965 TaxID=3346682 RepID=UPI0036C4DDE4